MRWIKNCWSKKIMIEKLCLKQQTKQPKMINGNYCFSGLQTVYLLNQEKIHMIEIMYSSGIFVNLITNIPMVVVNIKTSQLNVISTYMTSNLALSDINHQIFGIIPSLYLMVNRSSCTSEIIFNVIRHFLFTLWKYFVALISYDRYQHAKNTNRYAQIMTFKKVKRLQLASIAVVLSIAGLSFLSFTVLKLTITLLVMVPLLAVVIMVGYLYTRSIQLLNQYRLRSQRFSKNTVDLAKHAKHIIIVYALFYFIALGVTIINTFTQTNFRYFIYWLKQVYANFYQCGNAICFSISTDTVSNISGTFLGGIFQLTE